MYKSYFITCISCNIVTHDGNVEPNILADRHDQQVHLVGLQNLWHRPHSRTSTHLHQAFSTHETHVLINRANNAIHVPRNRHHKNTEKTHTDVNKNSRHSNLSITLEI